MLNALWVEAKVKEHFNCIAEKKTSLNYVIGKSDWTLFCCARGIQICLLFISTDNIFFIFSILVQRKKHFFMKLVFSCFSFFQRSKTQTDRRETFICGHSGRIFVMSMQLLSFVKFFDSFKPECIMFLLSSRYIVCTGGSWIPLGLADWISFIDKAEEKRNVWW